RQPRRRREARLRRPLRERHAGRNQKNGQHRDGRSSKHRKRQRARTNLHPWIHFSPQKISSRRKNFVHRRSEFWSLCDSQRFSSARFQSCRNARKTRAALAAEVCCFELSHKLVWLRRKPFHFCRGSNP